MELHVVVMSHEIRYVGRPRICNLTINFFRNSFYRFSIKELKN